MRKTKMMLLGVLLATASAVGGYRRGIDHMR
jgi:hypothetical protein